MDDPWADFKPANPEPGDPWAGFEAAKEPKAEPGQPSMMDYLQANPVIGAPTQTLLRAGQGIEQLLAHGAGLIPGLGGLPKRVDEAITAQNQGYEAAKQRVQSASTRPRVNAALTATGETMGNLLNPAGMAGSAIPAIGALGPVANAAVRGAASGAGYGASQPVLGDTSNYALEKAKQVGIGTGVGAGTGALAERLLNPAVKPPTAAELKAASKNAYDAAKAEGVIIKTSDFAQALDKAEAEAHQNLTYRPALQPKVATALGQIREEMDKSGGIMSFEDLDAARRIAATALESPQKSERAVGHLIQDKIDDYVLGLKPADVISSGDPEAAAAALTSARDLFSRSAKSSQMDRLMTRAKNAAGANYTTAGYETALRQQFRQLANNDKAFRRFSPDEQKAILKVVRGGPLQNVIRMAGKFAVRGPVGGAMYGGAAFYSGHPEIAAGMAGIGEAARMGATQMTSRNARLVDELVRSGGKMPALSPQAGPAPNIPVGNAASSLLLNLLLQPRGQ